jgi:hypothetical protein
MEEVSSVAATSRVVSQEVARHVLWHFGDYNNGLQPGKFTERLLLTISAADTGNRALLKRVFPEHVVAFEAVALKSWGLEWLQKIAREIV